MTGRKPLCEYEELRQRNLEDNKVILAKLMTDLAKVSPIPIVPRKQRKSQTKRVSDKIDQPLVVRRNPPRSARYNPVGLSPHMRSRRGSVSSSMSSASGSTDSTPTKSEKFVVRFGAFLRRSFDEKEDTYSDEEYDNEDNERALPTIKRKPRANRAIKEPFEITEQDLIRVAEHVSDKKYDNYYGTTCHQCRQKTDDQKTICHADNCFGVRGQFCGPCLKNRYGEDAKASLKNPEWICPPCRGICNCSFCRKKAGKCSTGILIHLAREHGYKDVNAYLESFRRS